MIEKKRLIEMTIEKVTSITLREVVVVVTEAITEEEAIKIAEVEEGAKEEDTEDDYQR